MRRGEVLWLRWRDIDLDRSRFSIVQTLIAPNYHVDGTPLHPHQFSQAFERHTKAAGLPKIRLHDLRHSYATRALQAGIHPKVVSERLGHSSISITLYLYSHAIPAMGRRRRSWWRR